MTVPVRQVSGEEHPPVLAVLPHYGSPDHTEEAVGSLVKAGYPNLLIVIIDNSGSMGVQPYNTYPTTIYTGSYDPGTIYTRCRNKNGIQGGNVKANCSCRRTQSSWPGPYCPICMRSDRVAKL